MAGQPESESQSQSPGSSGGQVRGAVQYRCTGVQNRLYLRCGGGPPGQVIRVDTEEAGEVGAPEQVARDTRPTNTDLVEMVSHENNINVVFKEESIVLFLYGPFNSQLKPCNDI